MINRDAWSLVVLLILSGCGGPPASSSDDLSDAEPQDVPPEAGKRPAEVSLVQSQGLKGATCLVYAAYNYPGQTEIDPVDGAKLVGVNVEFRNWKKGFDLDDIDIIDAAGNQNFGSDALIQFLTAQGQFIDNNDPDFDEEGPLRCLLIFAVPQTCQAIKLGYWGDILTPGATPLANTGPVRPESHEQVLHFARREAPDTQFDRYLLWIEATNWPRSSQPDWIDLSCDQGQAIVCGDTEAWVETDRQMNAVSSQIAGRPYYVPTRHFLVEVWFPRGKPPAYFGALRTQRVPLPAPKEFAIPQPTLAALDAAPRNPYAIHRRGNAAPGRP